MDNYEKLIKKIAIENIIVFSGIAKEYGLNITTYDTEGNMIYPSYVCNPICSIIKGTDCNKICQKANQVSYELVKKFLNSDERLIAEDFASRNIIIVKEDKLPPIIVTSCGSKFGKYMLPIMIDNEVVGCCGVCGVYLKGEKIDLDYISECSGVEARKFEIILNEVLSPISEKKITNLLAEMIKIINSTKKQKKFKLPPLL
ncbi:PocR ligand-binding domain-containing protein [Methanotorris igneus]|uniref:PocR domain-containing protein n=1 Tax=Methanotorris igneus (strain DSM 5666 / JCM 11834 / Kol 5) TaxID=880724 RepID=F6BB92_METIK|nr:PocR ligand-binding domain-containing protein [Methanotorris igneus]AEF95977.1 hypothetical protein Metig_0421 [Methanotorris igneus Kol 5]